MGSLTDSEKSREGKEGKKQISVLLFFKKKGKKRETSSPCEKLKNNSINEYGGVLLMDFFKEKQFTV